MSNTLLTHECPVCGGDGKDTCTNPDHGFISMVGGDIGRIGCPCCGHDENHKMPGGGKCEDCNGVGAVSKETCEKIILDLQRKHICADDYVLDEPFQPEQP